MSERRLLAVLFAACALPGAASAAAPAGASPPPVSDHELGEMRGGFTVDGITFGFGAEVRTYVDGKLALQTKLTWTDKGAVTRTTRGDLGTRLRPDRPTGGLNLQGLKGAKGVLISDPSGATAIAHRTTADGIDNLVINSASNRDIRQEVQLNLAIPELAKMQADFGRAQASARLDQGMTAGALNALRR